MIKTEVKNEINILNTNKMTTHTHTHTHTSLIKQQSVVTH